MLPAALRATLCGAARSWLAGGTVVMVPPATLRIALLRVSAIKRLPFEATATAPGAISSALMAAALSPAYPALPFPATVPIRLPETLRTRLLPVSAMYRLADESIATEDGWYNWALAGAPP